MTDEVFVCPRTETRFKIEGGAHSCALYVYDEENMDYNHLENISAGGSDRVDRGLEIAARYADCRVDQFEFERSDYRPVTR